MTDILYAAPLSLYSGKARAYLDWKGIDYSEQLATPDVYRDIIVPHIGRPVIPVLQLADGTVIQDTTRIIDHYETSLGSPSVYPDTPLQNLVALLLETYGDEWLVIPAMHYRWRYNEEWVYGEFGKLALPNGDATSQYAAGKARAAMFKAFVPVLGITPETAPAIETSYKALLGDLEHHFQNHDFLLGTRPSIGDLGLIGPLYAHLYRDPVSGELMQRIAPQVVRWVERMVNVKAPLSGAFLEGDVIPDTLLPVLRRMMQEQMPSLQLVATAFAAWVAAHPCEAVPRAVGTVSFVVEGVTGARIASPYSLWMLQRALDAYQKLSPDKKAKADALLDIVNGDAFMSFDLPRRVQFVSQVIEPEPVAT